MSVKKYEDKALMKKDVSEETDVERKERKTLDFGNVRFLQQDAVELRFAGGRNLKVYGAGDLPRCGPDEFA